MGSHEQARQAGHAGKNTVRVFFAIWPDTAVREQLLEMANGLQRNPGCSGRKIKAENIHLTLVFVGNVDHDGLEALRHAAEGIARTGRKSFELVIQGVGYWKRNRIVFAALNEIPQALKELVSQLGKAIELIGFSTEERAYKPHVTLMRDAVCPMLLHRRIEPVVWKVREWLLVKSEQTGEGVAYSPVDRWTLGTPE
ncbi:MAG TPA: RNA 2',3'-cyclic phosphodiesterase [Nitrosospira sp.]|nr:RNA 2',3'-cyclic phosphodiesterase [Nitrosospira sp.]